MNERIQQLAEQAGAIEAKDITNIPRALSLNGEEIEKFAELIVKDFLDIANEVRGKPSTETYYVIGYDRACEKMIDAIKESYGVEE